MAAAPAREEGAPDLFGLAGTVLDRKYRVDHVVAAGGFGLVYAGHHLALDQPIAIKVLKQRPEISVDGWHELLARFVQEAQMTARLRHPNIATILDTGIAELAVGPVPWMVLEWLEGRTLDDELTARRSGLRGGGRSPAEALELLRPVLQAIAEAHEAGIAHRDLKPSNVMLVPTRSGRSSIRLLDFGIAKLMNDEPETSSGHTTTEQAFRAYSIGYAAPEQVAGKRTGPWTDVHALGLILTEILTDASPYGDDDAMPHALVFDVRRPTPARFGVDVGAWEPVIARAVALRPSERFANAGEMLAALEAHVPSRERSPDHTIGSTRRRRWLEACGVVAGTVVLLLGTRSALRSMSSHEAPATPRASTTAADTATATPSASPSATSSMTAPATAIVPASVKAIPTASTSAPPSLHPWSSSPKPAQIAPSPVATTSPAPVVSDPTSSTPATAPITSATTTKSSPRPQYVPE